MRLFLFTIYLLLSFHNAFAIDKDTIKGDWKFIYGDNFSYSDIGIDESGWVSVKLDEPLPVNRNYDLVGWYRVHFDAHVDVSEQYALLIDNLRLGDETWINGVRVGGLGGFDDNWQFKHNNPFGLLRKYDLPAGFLQYKDNVLAIKIATGFGKAKAAVLPVGRGIGGGSESVFLAELKEARVYYNKQIVKTSTLDTVFMTMGLIELLILLVLVRSALDRGAGFKWLLFPSIMLFIIGIGHDSFFIFGFDFSYGYFTSSLVFAFSLLFVPLSLFLYFWSQFKEISANKVLVLAIVYFSLCCLIVLPFVPDAFKKLCWYAWMFLTTAFVGYYFYTAITAIKCGRVGSVAQLLGLIALIVLALLHNFSNGFLGHRNIQIGSMLYRYFLLLAYFQQIWSIRFDFKNLSVRMVNVVEDINAKIARELHDGIGQHLASMKIHAQLLATGLNDKQLPSLNIITSELDNSTSSLRQLINGLHPAIIDKYSIYQSIARECIRFESISPIKIKLSGGSEHSKIKLSKNIKLNIFRIFQECVSNAIKHGKAKNIDVFLSLDKHLVLMSIEDDGCGYQLSQQNKLSDIGGLGFISLRERVALLNGQIDFDSLTNHGSNVRLVIPLD